MREISRGDEQGRREPRVPAFSIGDALTLECRRNLTAFPDAFTASFAPRPDGEDASPPSVVSGASTHGGPAVASDADDSAEWGPAIKCLETGQPLSFPFGRESFVYCGWILANEDTYKFAAAVMQQQAAWQCRIPMSKDRKFFLPVLIPLWGVVEATHLHLNYHSQKHKQSHSQQMM